MKKHFRLISVGLIATSMLALSSMALADSMEKSCDNDPKGSKSAMHEGGIERLNRIEKRLKLTPEQQPLWDSFIATSTHSSHGHMGTLATADKLQMMKTNMEMMHRQRLARIESMQALYAALDASQQAIFDKALKHPYH